MIFDSNEVLSLIESRTDENANVIDSHIHRKTRSLIESIAASLCPISNNIDFNDLVQEGHLKLQHVIVNNLYVSTRGTLYSFLSFVLKNTMIDFVRKYNKEVKGDIDVSLSSLFPSPPSSVLSSQVSDSMTDCLSYYLIHRFPSVQDRLSLLHASIYITTALCESVYNKSRGIQKTLSYMYGFPSTTSKVMYRSVIVYLRLHGLSHINYPDGAKDFIQSNPSLELSNIPDIALLIGPSDVSMLLDVFYGMRIVI